jgi:hypothetical protein
MGARRSRCLHCCVRGLSGGAVTEGTVEKHVRSILGKLNLPEAPDDHRGVRAVITFLESRWPRCATGAGSKSACAQLGEVMLTPDHLTVGRQ